jgi:hypothetical protein
VESFRAFGSSNPDISLHFSPFFSHHSAAIEDPMLCAFSVPQSIRLYVLVAADLT